jgi:serine/threonine protein kinase
MEYVPGTSLRPLIERRELSADHAVDVLRQVLTGLSHAHQHGVIHRDIKPENILVHEGTRSEGFGTRGSIKVTDFGLGAAVASSLQTGSIAYSQSIGGADAKRISGTIDYMSPEQRSGGMVDARADLYACGVMLYEMLTGEKPAGTDLPSDLNPKTPRWLDEVFKRSYARLEKRFTTAEEFLVALKAPAGPPPLPVPPPIPGGRPEMAHDGGRNCPSCRRSVGAADQFCMHCGVQLVEWVLRCPQCGAYPDPADRFCIFCGVAVSTQGVA